MSLLFNMLSGLVITFLSRSKHLLTSWLQSPPAVTFGAQEKQSVTVPIVSPCIFHEVMVPDAMILAYLPYQLLTRVLLLAVPCTIAQQAPLSMGFSRQQYWSGLPFPSMGDLPHPGIEPGSPALQVDSLPTELFNTFDKSSYQAGSWRKQVTEWSHWPFIP